MKKQMMNLLQRKSLPLALLLFGLMLMLAPQSAQAVSGRSAAQHTAEELLAPQGLFSHLLGNDHTQDGGFTDLHNPGLFINEADTYRNKTPFIQQISIDRFNFYAKKVANPVTPVVVRVDGDNDFTVIAIGKTQTSYVVGANSFNFADSPTTINVTGGGKIATGFIDADANGQNWGQGGNPIPATANGAMGQKASASNLDQDEVWALLPQPLIHFDPGEPDYEAYDPSIDTPALVLGQKIMVTNSGKAVKEYDLLRSYHFSIEISSNDIFDGAVIYANSNLSGTSAVLSDGFTQLADTAVGENSVSSLSVKSGYIAYLCKKLIDHPNPGKHETEVCKQYPPGDYSTLFGWDDGATFAKVEQNNPAVHGRWGDVIELPQRAIAAAQLPDGNVMFWQGGQPTGAGVGISVINPKTLATWDSGAPMNHDTFCPGPALMADGSLILAGGGRGGVDPFSGDVYEDASSIFDWDSNSWIRTEDMQEPHYYGTTVAMANGEVFHALGSSVAANDWEFQSDNPEIWDGTSWQKLTGLDVSPLHANNGFYNSNYYPYLHQMPNSNLFHSGGVPTMHEINPNDQTIFNQGTRAGNDQYRHWGNSIMIDEGILFISGGRTDKTESSRSTVLVDINDELEIKSEYAQPMSYDRAFHNMVQLPTGDVFVSGGNSSGKIFIDYGTVYPTEMWDRETGTWSIMADVTTPRNYHSTSFLLPDGRIWQAGGDCEHCPSSPDYPGTKSFKHHYNLQIYSPPYLFNANGTLALRPKITAYPTGENGVKASTSFDVTVTGSGHDTITDFAFIKMSSTTHQINTDVRRLSLPFTSAGNGSYTLDAHDNINVMTPGYWMLFAINGAGVPSEAAIVHVSSELGTVNPIPKAKPVKIPMGNPSVAGLVDGFNSNLIVNKSDTYTNETGKAEELILSEMSFYAANTDGPVTPFVVTVNGNNDYTIKAIGDTRYPAEIGSHVYPFSDADPAPRILVQANEKIAIGFIDAKPDGTSPPPERSIVAYKEDDKDQVYYAGAATGNLTTLVVDQPLTLNNPAFYRSFVNKRDYSFGVLLIKPPNRNPIITQPSDQQDNKNGSVNLTIVATDPDEDPIQFSAAGLPAGLTINPTSGAITGQPTTAGNYIVTVTAEDDANGSASADFLWSINDPGSSNQNPTVSDPGDQSDTTIVPVDLTISATDPDGGTLAYSADGLPPGLLINGGTGKISGAPQPTAAGDYLVTLTVLDGQGGLASVTFNWTITKIPNEEPVLTNPGSQASEVGQTVMLTLEAADADSDPLSFTAVDLPDGLTLNAGSGAISGTPTAVGTFTVVLKVEDNKAGVDEKSIVWTVNKAGTQLVDLGNGFSLLGSKKDTWFSNIIVNESDTFINSSSETVALNITSFDFFASTVDAPVTPFVVQVNGDNDFTVLAVGTTRMVDEVGQYSLPFVDGSVPQVLVGPGVKVAVGFLDANADGTSPNGESNSVIPYLDSGDEVWYVGAASGVVASVTAGQPPTIGATVRNMERDYAFTIMMNTGEPTIGGNKIYLPFVIR